MSLCATASDPDDDVIAYEWSLAINSGASLDDPTNSCPTGLFPIGPTLVTVTVTDGNGGVAVDDVLITVQDTTPPVLICTTDTIALWPPDHSMQSVAVFVQISDACAAPEQMMLTCLVLSNESDDSTGDGSLVGDVNGLDGFTAPVPVVLTNDPGVALFFGSVNLRAERSGLLAGRTYSFACSVQDTSGNTSTASCVVVVPHDKRKK